VATNLLFHFNVHPIVKYCQKCRAGTFLGTCGHCIKKWEHENKLGGVGFKLTQRLEKSWVHQSVLINRTRHLRLIKNHGSRKKETYRGIVHNKTYTMHLENRQGELSFHAEFHADIFIGHDFD